MGEEEPSVPISESMEVRLNVQDPASQIPGPSRNPTTESPHPSAGTPSIPVKEQASIGGADEGPPGPSYVAQHSRRIDSITLTREKIQHLFDV